MKNSLEIHMKIVELKGVYMENGPCNIASPRGPITIVPVLKERAPPGDSLNPNPNALCGNQRSGSLFRLTTPPQPLDPSRGL